MERPNTPNAVYFEREKIRKARSSLHSPLHFHNKTQVNRLRAPSAQTRYLSLFFAAVVDRDAVLKAGAETSEGEVEGVGYKCAERALFEVRERKKGKRYRGSWRRSVLDDVQGCEVVENKKGADASGCELETLI